MVLKVARGVQTYTLLRPLGNLKKLLLFQLQVFQPQKTPKPESTLLVFGHTGTRYRFANKKAVQSQYFKREVLFPTTYLPTFLGPNPPMSPIPKHPWDCGPHPRAGRGESPVSMIFPTAKRPYRSPQLRKPLTHFH